MKLRLRGLLPACSVLKSSVPFVHLFNKTDVSIHISERLERTEHVEDVVKVGGTVTVKIIKIDEKDVSMPQSRPAFLSLKS